MAVEVKVPSVGESITEGTIARWLKKDGETVRAEEPLFELETEKATTEVAAPASGALRITVPEGKTVAVGSVVAQIEEGATAPAATAVPPPASEPEPRVSPAARRLAAETGVDVRQVKGTGRDGVILKEDVQAHAEQRPAPAEPPPAKPQAARPAAGERETRQRMSAIRQRIAERLLASQKTTATLTTFNEADLSAV
ncbi:MAG TPA: biotin/lipoyl-containing protein, partial [Gemmataceae bacterium]|nr:biotin/lipoyl-containing protein [Gemmataceae bacterium]